MEDVDVELHQKCELFDPFKWSFEGFDKGPKASRFETGTLYSLSCSYFVVDVLSRLIKAILSSPLRLVKRRWSCLIFSVLMIRFSSALARRNLSLFLSVCWFFEALSGLKTNRTKCQILGISCDKEKIKSQVEEVGSYLGFPLGGNLGISFQALTVDKIGKRLVSWKNFLFLFL